jgi:hypothetical protein
MSKHGPDPSDPLVRWLAEEAVVADLFQTSIDGIGKDARKPAAEAVSIRALLAYVWRDPGAPSDLAIERALRDDATTAQRYRNLLRGMAQAFSERAIAAASDEVPSRMIGKWKLRVSAPRGQLPVLVLTHQESALTHQDPAPAAIEAVGVAKGPIRLPLPEPVNQSIQLPLNDEFPELKAFRHLLAETDTQIFLLPSLAEQ